MEKYVVDRIEEGFAVLEKESGEIIELKAEDFPYIKRGDVVSFKDGRYFVDEEETAKRKEIVSEKMRKLFAKKNNL